MKRALILLALAEPGIAHAQSAKPCPGFDERGTASITDADRFYGLRAADILRLAMAGDRARLAALVAPGAMAGVAYGDAIWGPSGANRRDPDPTGVDAMIALVDRLKPRGFLTTQSIPGPFSVTVLKCSWTVSLLIRGDEPGYAVSLKFVFEDGMLANVTGAEVGVIEGKLP